MASVARHSDWLSLEPTTVDDLIAEAIRTGSAYSARRVSAEPAAVTIQLEYAGDRRLYLGFDRADLRAYVAPLERALRLLDLTPGATLGLYDFGSSPIVYLASSLYLPYMGPGAADRLGCTVICNDGGANLAQRAVEIFEYVRPRVAILRSDCLEPVVAACVAARIDISKYTEALVITRNDAAMTPAQVDRAARELRVRVLRLPRSDMAMFLAVECTGCGLLHVPPDLYRVEIVDLATTRSVPAGTRGRLVVTSLFAEGTLSLRVLTSVEGALVQGRCSRAGDDVLIALT